MELHHCEDHEALSRWAAVEIVAALRRKPDLLFCAATGQTPRRTYALLAEHHRQESALFKHLRVLKLDEWHGLPMTAPETCEAYLRRHLLGPLGLPDAQYLGFDSAAPDPATTCRAVADGLAAHGPIDLCLLGLGVNGHIGFIEPGRALALHAHFAPLTSASQAHTMVRSLRTPPTHGLTLGIGDIMQARAVLLLVSGVGKQEPLAHLQKKEISTDFPASFLWLHPHATCAFDADAAGGSL